MVVPTVLSMLLDVPVEGLDLSRLKYALCGAAPLSVQVFKAFEDHSGLRLLEGYGLTEATLASSCNPRNGVSKVNSVGIRWPYQEMKTVILDQNGEYVRDCEVDEIGVIVLRGPSVFKGYVEEAHSERAWVRGDWLKTGDMGRVDKDEYFWLTGRKKELIIRAATTSTQPSSRRSCSRSTGWPLRLRWAGPTRTPARCRSRISRPSPVWNST